VKNFNNISDAVLIHMWHVSFDLLCKFGSQKAWIRHYLIIAELDKRGI
jgi:hypothetical protein